MKIGRRATLGGGAALLAVPAARARDWPEKTVTWVVPFPAGGPSDAFARTVAELVGAELGQTIVIDNKSGAGGSLGAAVVARAAPDGYTLGLISVASHTINPQLYTRLPYDPDKDIIAVSRLALLVNLLGVTANLPANIARSWARWGRSRHYVCDAEGKPLRPHNEKVTCPVQWLSFTDDPIAPYEAVEALRPYYPGAAVERRHLAPADLGAGAVGHFGFFRKSMPRAAWDELASWLGARLHVSRMDGQTGRAHQPEEPSLCQHPTFSPKSRMASAG